MPIKNFWSKLYKLYKVVKGLIDKKGFKISFRLNLCFHNWTIDKVTKTGMFEMHCTKCQATKTSIEVF